MNLTEADMPLGQSLFRAGDHAISLPSLSLSNEVPELILVQLADPQFGLLERYIEHRPKPYGWSAELAQFQRILSLATGYVKPRPLSVIITGDLVDSQPSRLESMIMDDGDPAYRVAQIADLKSAISQFSNSIPTIVLPGNHDVCDAPTKLSLAAYKEAWGDDYFAFQQSGFTFLVLNTQLWVEEAKEVAEFTALQESWLESQLERSTKQPGRLIIFQHIPFYLNRFDEEPGYFNLPLKVRHHWLPRLFHAGARHVFSGHLHYNCTATWLPGPGISESLELVTTSSTGAQLGSDAPGFRLISLDPHSARLRHRYFALSEAEALVADGRSICIDS